MTYYKGIVVNPSLLNKSISKAFKSSSFKNKLNKIINDTCLFAYKYSNKKLSAAIDNTIQDDELLHGVQTSTTQTENKSDDNDELLLLLLLLVGKTANYITDKILTEMKKGITASYNNIKNIFEKNISSAKLFIQNSIGQIATKARIMTLKSNGVKYFRFKAVIDNRTSPQCRLLNGTVLRADDSNLSRYFPPIHLNCRSNLEECRLTDDKMLFENRDFVHDYFTKGDVQQIFKNINSFVDKYKFNDNIMEKSISVRLSII
jgi:SPP1 gp7 family putative phage head morphogenesis protein